MSIKLGIYDPTTVKLKETIVLAKECGTDPKVIEAMEESLKLCQLRDQATLDTTTKQSPTCAKIVEETNNHDWKTVFEQKKTTCNLMPVMMSGHLEGQFLKSYLSAQKAKRVLDIGMFTGYSAMSMAEILPEDGEVVTLDIEDYLKGLVEDLIKDSPHQSKIRIVIGNALETMANMRDNGVKFDAVFMDASKDEYEDYFRLRSGFQSVGQICLDGNLVAPGGTVIIDNAYYFGTLYTEPDSSTAKIGEMLRGRSDLHVVLVPIRDGIYLVRRRADVDGGVV